VCCGVVEAKRLQRLFFKGASSSASANASSSASASILPSSGDITRNLVAYTYLRKRFKHLSAEAFKNMIKTYGITYTDEMYRDKWKYRSRIIFPNILCGKVVSFQTRSYNQNARIKYLTADPTEEVVPHKSFLWGIDWVPFNKIIVTEGVMDALTIGAGAVHTHGVNFTQEQVQCLHPFDHVFIAYDMDDAGCKASKALASALSHRTKVTRIRLSQHDVNSCSEQEIKEIQGVLK